MSKIKQRHKVRIEAEMTASGTKVFLDDKELFGVRNVIFDHPVGREPRVVLELIPEEVLIEGDATTEFALADLEVVDASDHGDNHVVHAFREKSKQ